MLQGAHLQQRRESNIVRYEMPEQTRKVYIVLCQWTLQAKDVCFRFFAGSKAVTENCWLFELSLKHLKREVLVPEPR